MGIFLPHATSPIKVKFNKKAIPLTEADSRLGWEPSMEYVTDPEHLRWKIEQVRQVIDRVLPEYAASLGRK
jgi:hypothetical protein